jgi:hypothetical protein
MATKQKPAATPASRIVAAVGTARAGKRPQLGIIVSQETKDLIEQLAHDDKCSMGQMVEHLIHEALHTRQLLTDVRSSVRTEEVGTRVLGTVLFRRLWTPVDTDQGDKVWAPPGTKLPITITRKL